MIEKLEAFIVRYRELETMVQDPNLTKNPVKYRDTMREHSRLGEIIASFETWKKLILDLEGAKTIGREETDPDLREMAKEEAKELEAKVTAQEEALNLLLIPVDPLDEKNVIVEIRAGTGGDEAALFAADLYRMYFRWSENRRWKTEVLSTSETGIGGYKEIIFSVSGHGAFGSLRWESGVHRVQRVPTTEAQGRIHTSAVTVAVLPEVEETEINLKPEDLRIDVMRAGGPGGQCVNTTDSAVRITHIPSGIVVHCQDEKSQIKNKAKAMKVLIARIYEAEEEKKQSERAAERRSMIGSGDRSERIRTYNFPQNRLTDHRVNLTLYKLELVMQGDLDEVVDALKLRAREELLKAEA